MSRTPKAVFLSYASQDAEAARRICEALRSAGVEVWFDQSELRGGDAWDAKIRRQIKECALFVPVISANTNARPEGYFRLEWKLAVDRSHLIADDQPFLMPVIIGDVPEPSARVPDKFRDVQWTRLRLDETPAEFGARVQTLLTDAGAGSASSSEDTRPGSAGRRSDSKPAASIWWTRIFPLAGIAVGLFYALRPLWLHDRKSPDRPRSEAAAASTRGVTAERKSSEARQLALRARAMTLDKYSSGPDDYAAAEPLIKRALELDPTDAEIWAISSLFNTGVGTRGFDHSSARREVARSHAERALSLAPDSIEGLYALGRWQRDNEPNAALAEATFKKVLARDPNHNGAVLTLAIHYHRRERFDEALPLFEKAAERPETRPLALYNLFLGYFTRSRFVEAERAVRGSIAAEPAANSQAGLALFLLTAKGDADGAAQAVATGPAAARSDHRIIWITAYAHLLRRAPDDVLQTLSRFSDDFIQDNWFVGPKSYWAGRAHALAGRKEAARIAWEAGLRVMTLKLAQDPQSGPLRVMQAELLALLGREEEALREARAVEELQRGRYWTWPETPVRVHAALGRAEEALALLRTADQRAPGESTGWPMTSALLRLDPSWDPIRNHPKFAEKMAAAEKAEQAAVARSQRGDAAAQDKSVAVLAFANLSNDKANEYFSDGISEELLNVLGKVPGLRVVGRTSSFSFKGTQTPAPEIGQKLGVAYLVEGSVRKEGTQVRISASLSRADTGQQLWRDSYDKELKNIFALQDEIARDIAQKLQLQLGGGSRATRPINPEAHRLVLEGRHFWNTRKMEDLNRAEARFREALKIDPDFALAHANLSICLGSRAAFMSGDDKPASARDIAAARQSAEAALKIDPTLLEAQAGLAWAAFLDGDIADAERRLRAVLRTNPNYALAHQHLGYLFSETGRLDLALEATERAVQYDPLQPQFAHLRASLLMHARRNAEAVRTIERSLDLRNDFIPSRGILARSLHAMGRVDEALREAERIRNDSTGYRGNGDLTAIHILRLAGREQAAAEYAAAVLPKLPPGGVRYRSLFLALGRYDEALDLTAPTPGSPFFAVMLYWSELWDPVRNDPRFAQLLERYGCAAHYKTARESFERILRETEAKK